MSFNVSLHRLQARRTSSSHPAVVLTQPYSVRQRLSSCIPPLVKSYFLAAADLFGHSGACVIDVFLAVKHLLYPSLHPLLHPTLGPRKFGGMWTWKEKNGLSVSAESVWSTYRCWQWARGAANAVRGWPPDIILRIAMALKNAFPACSAPGIISARNNIQQRSGALGKVWLNTQPNFKIIS